MILNRKSFERLGDNNDIQTERKYVRFTIRIQHQKARPGRSVGCTPAWYSDGRGFGPPVRQNIGHKIIATAILSLALIQVGQFSVTGKRMCTKYWLTL